MFKSIPPTPPLIAISHKKGGVALSGHPHKNFSERRDFCKLRSNLNAMFDVFGLKKPKMTAFGWQIKLVGLTHCKCDSPRVRGGTFSKSASPFFAQFFSPRRCRTGIPGGNNPRGSQAHRLRQAPCEHEGRRRIQQALSDRLRQWPVPFSPECPPR